MSGAERDTGLHLTTPRSRLERKSRVGPSTDWATQVPRFLCILRENLPPTFCAASVKAGSSEDDLRSSRKGILLLVSLTFPKLLPSHWHWSPERGRVTIKGPWLYSLETPKLYATPFSYTPLKEKLSSNTKAKWKQMFFYQKGSQEWLQILRFAFWVAVPTDFLVHHDSPCALLGPLAGTRAQTGPGHGSWGFQWALKTEAGLEFSVSARLQSHWHLPILPCFPHPSPLPQNRPESHFFARRAYSLAEFIFPFWGREACLNSSEMGRVLGTQAPPPLVHDPLP